MATEKDLENMIKADHENITNNIMSDESSDYYPDGRLKFKRNKWQFPTQSDQPDTTNDHCEEMMKKTDS